MKKFIRWSVLLIVVALTAIAPFAAMTAPAEQPRVLSAIVVFQCGKVFVAWITFSDGTLLMADKASGVSIDALRELLSSAPQTGQLTLECTVIT